MAGWWQVGQVVIAPPYRRHPTTSQTQVAGLSTTETITYVLHSAFGFSQSEIALFRRVKEGTVKQTLHRANKKLAVEDAA